MKEFELLSDDRDGLPSKNLISPDLSIEPAETICFGLFLVKSKDGKTQKIANRMPIENKDTIECWGDLIITLSGNKCKERVGISCYRITPEGIYKSMQ